jgi:hypothetical protein
VHHATAGEERADAERAFDASSGAEQVDGPTGAESFVAPLAGVEVEDIGESTIEADGRSPGIQPGGLEHVRLERVEQSA